MQNSDVESVVRGIFEAYENKDRFLAEELIASDFSFTSPLDNHLDRSSYFEICWPNSQNIESFDLEKVQLVDDKAYVVYNAASNDKKFRNAEILTVKNGKITAVEVYFGWDLPHPTHPRCHILKADEKALTA